MEMKSNRFCFEGKWTGQTICDVLPGVRPNPSNSSII